MNIHLQSKEYVLLDDRYIEHYAIIEVHNFTNFCGMEEFSYLYCKQFTAPISIIWKKDDEKNTTYTGLGTEIEGR